MLNLGCGHRFHPAWENVDVAIQDPSIRRADISQGIPYPDQHFDVVYHSHLIEHIRVSDVQRFLRDCWRVLTPGGIMRIATPDLERLCALYLDRLRASAATDHEWLVIEMFDQTVREQTGGAMLDYLRQDPLPNEAFVLARIGEEGRDLLASIRNGAPSAASSQEPGFRQRIKEALVRRWYGPDALLAMQIGKFRLSGEVHQWLYDQLSLRRILAAAGFCDATPRTAGESAIAGWSGFFLEVTPGGQVIKPDSMFMEARKPT
jgi:SAM-dependent methyltransferase